MGMNEQSIRSLDFDNAVGSLEFFEKRQKIVSHFFCVGQHLEKNIGALNDFYTKWKKACPENKLASWDTLLSEILYDWHDRIRLTHIKNKIRPLKSRTMGLSHSPYNKSRYFWKHVFNKRPPISEKISNDNVNNYHNYLSYLCHHHYAINIAMPTHFSNQSNPLIFLSLPLAENGTDVTHILSAVNPH
ncbi:MAG: hypothetical protein KDF58_13490 [Alphaproteobacteria bacterium]|nr:hypothetical protein [Alphaproteobacteria bacterium]